MRNPLRRREGSPDRLGPGDPMPPLPPEPFYTSEARGDDLPSPPFSDNPDDLDSLPMPRPDPRDPTLGVGDRITERVYHDPFRPTGWSLSWDMDRFLRTVSHPARIYEVRDVSGLRWERWNGRGGWALHYDEATVAAELPSWRVFGPHGAEVEQVLESVALLTPDQVRRLSAPPTAQKFRIPGEAVRIPESHPGRQCAESAASTAMRWTENRAWAVDPEAGGHYYRGCYFVYLVNDPHWLSVMGRAMNAAIAAILDDDLPAGEARRVEHEWVEVLDWPH